MTVACEYLFKSITYLSKDLHSQYKPIVVGNFSVSKEGNIINCNTGQLPKIKDPLPRLPLNLCEGYDPKIRDSEELEKNRRCNFPEWEKPLRWLVASEHGYSMLNDVNVVTQRGILKDMGYTLYKPTIFDNGKPWNGWSLEVCKYDGKLYIRRIPTDAKSKVVAKGLPKLIYMGMKFEEVIIDPPGDNIRSCFNVLKGTIWTKRVLLSAEVDAVRYNAYGEEETIEVKTCINRDIIFCRNLPYSWLQSFLAGVDVLCYGIRNRDGYITEPIQEFRVSEIPYRHKKIKKNDAYDAMIGFIGDILDWLYETVPDEDQVWSLESFFSQNEERRILLEKKRGRFLPDYYKEFVDKHTTAVEQLETDFADLHMSADR